MLANWISLAVVLLATLAGYYYRIRIEERVLREELGDSYRAYSDHTPYRLLPFVW
jgi:protein-S-isoprenylcysteine O-methyltransferase Ste14